MSGTGCGRANMCQACSAKGGCGKECRIASAQSELLMDTMADHDEVMIVRDNDDYSPEDWYEPDFDEDLDDPPMLRDRNDEDSFFEKFFAAVDAAVEDYEYDIFNHEDDLFMDWGRKPRSPKPATWRRIAGPEFQRRVRQLANSWNCSLKEAENRFFGFRINKAGGVVEMKKPRRRFPRPDKHVSAHRLEQ